MLKDAVLKADVELQPHQARALAKIQSEPSVLLYHGLGGQFGIVVMHICLRRSAT